MLVEAKMKKVNKLASRVTTEANINNGKLFILTRQRKKLQRD